VRQERQITESDVWLGGPCGRIAGSARPKAMTCSWRCAQRGWWPAKRKTRLSATFLAANAGPGGSARANRFWACLAIGVLAAHQAVTGLTARMIAECIPGAASFVKVTDASVNPAAARPSRYSARDRAPAMQPT
jgi:hypothetical protein